MSKDQRSRLSSSPESQDVFTKKNASKSVYIWGLSRFHEKNATKSVKIWGLSRFHEKKRHKDRQDLRPEPL